MNDKKVEYKLPKHRVSGVPYEVNLDSVEHYESAIEVLELENRLMRARMDRLEDELKTANELISRLSIQNMNYQEKMKEFDNSGQSSRGSH